MPGEIKIGGPIAGQVEAVTVQGATHPVTSAKERMLGRTTTSFVMLADGTIATTAEVDRARNAGHDLSDYNQY